MKLILGKSELVLAVLCVTLLRSQRIPIWRHFSLHYLKLAPFLFESSYRKQQKGSSDRNNAKIFG